MKPVVCYAVAAMPFATPGSAAIADLLAIGSGGYFRVGDRMALAKKNSTPRSFKSLLCPDRTYDGAGA